MKCTSANAAASSYESVKRSRPDVDVPGEQLLETGLEERRPPLGERGPLPASISTPSTS